MVQACTIHIGEYLGQDLVVPREEGIALGRVSLSLLCSEDNVDQGGSRMMPTELFRHRSSSSVRPKSQTTQEKSYGLRMTRAQPLILGAVPPGSGHKDRISNAFVLFNLATHLQN